MRLVRRGIVAPDDSILFTPRPVHATETPEGVLKFTVPKGSAAVHHPFDAASKTCDLVREANQSSSGLVRCLVPEIAPGHQKKFFMRWDLTDNAIDVSVRATYKLPGTRLRDREQIPFASY